MYRKSKCLLTLVSAACLINGNPVFGDPIRSAPLDRPTHLSLATYQEPTERETTTVTTTTSVVREESWEISGPVFLRSADPEPPGEIIIKNIFEWETFKKSDDDSSEFWYELEIEYGLIENHELIFEVPTQIGEGDENGDITLGWHWRLWEESDGWPAFAIRNYFTLPTGTGSEGVDYELRGLFTKTLIPGSTRFHVNPFLRVVDTDDDDEDPGIPFIPNEDEEDEERDFQWGVALGVDHWLRENLLLIADYKYSSSEHEGWRDQHTAELGIDWHIDERQTLGLAAEVSLDGDHEGPCFAARVSYMLSFGGD